MRTPACIFVVFTSLLLNFSCAKHDRKKTEIFKFNQAIKLAPDTVTIKPTIVYLKTRPAPTIFKVISKPASFTISSSNKKLGDRVFCQTKPFSFFQTMQNYNIEQGLSSSVMFNGCVDKDGNLWFGSIGGGAMKFDGKNFTAYTTASGLIHDGVYSVFQDSYNNYWFSTQGGASRYDGKHFTNFTTAQGLPNDVVFNVFEDSRKNIWLSTINGGVSCYNGRTFLNYTTQQGLANNVVYRTIEDNNGNIYCGTDSGISVLYRNSSSFTYFGPKEKLSVWTAVKDKNGDLWFGSNNGLLRFEKPGFKSEKLAIIKYTTAQGLLSNDINCFMQSKDGSYWIGTDAGLSCWEKNNQDPGNFHITNYTVTQGLTNTVVKSILEDSDRNIWIGTLGGGIFRLDKGGKVFSMYGNAPGLVNNMSGGKIFEDRNNNLWFCGDNGMSKLSADKKQIITYTFNSVEGAANISSIVQDKEGNFWFCNAGDGLYYFNPSKNRMVLYSSGQGLPDNGVYQLCMQKDGNLFMLTGSGISSFNGKKFTNYSSSLFNYCFVDRKQNIWIGSDSGLIRFDGSTFINYSKQQGLSFAVFSINEDSFGNLWLGTNHGGVSRFDGSSFLNFNIADKLTDNVGDCVAIDKQGRIWIGTPKGISLFKNFDKVNKSMLQEDFLNASNNYSNAYLITHYFLPHFENYNDQTGYPFREIYFLTATHDDLIWGAGSDKIISFNYSKIHKNFNPQKVLIQDVKINDEYICWSDLAQSNKTAHNNSISSCVTDEVTLFGKRLSTQEIDTLKKKYGDIKFDGIAALYPVPLNLVLPHNHNNITFDFMAVEPANSQLVKYQYMLQGYDKDWSVPENKTSVTYGNIYEGTYTFLVKAKSVDGIWSSPISYTFKVLPPWYRTWWAYCLYAIELIFLIMQMIRWRTRTLTKEKAILEEKLQMQNAVINERLRISRDLHDDIGSTLGSISIYSEVAKNRSAKNENAEEAIAKIGNASRELIDKMSDIVWSVNPNNETFEQLINRMQVFAAIMLTPHEILYTIEANEQVKHLKLTTEERKNIYLIYKEAIHNIIKYAQCSQVEIKMLLQAHEFIMSIKDNGKGFDINEVQETGSLNSNGIKNMQARAASINAQLDINSTVNEGTSIIFCMKI
ncbi:MAG TPA: two-component regulator propeller domain-containing protein [Parafilimonas sp.]|nr:two-component regulator propeller domain-containing protein [Parafilimonas sp.]